MAPPLWAGEIVGPGRAKAKDGASPRQRLQLDTGLLDALEVMSDDEFQEQLTTHASLQDSLAEWNNRFSPLLAGSPARERFSPNVAAHTNYGINMPLSLSPSQPRLLPEPEPEPVTVPETVQNPEPGAGPVTGAPVEVSLGELRGPLRSGELLTRLGPQAYNERRREAAAMNQVPPAIESPLCWVEDITGPVVRAALRDCAHLHGYDEGTRLRALARAMRQHAQVTNYLDNLLLVEHDKAEAVGSDEGTVSKCEQIQLRELGSEGNASSLGGDPVAGALSEALWHVYMNSPRDPLAMLAQLLETASERVPVTENEVTLCAGEDAEDGESGEVEKDEEDGGEEEECEQDRQLRMTPENGTNLGCRDD